MDRDFERDIIPMALSEGTRSQSASDDLLFTASHFI
jgi:hypothetical protein